MRRSGTPDEPDTALLLHAHNLIKSDPVRAAIIFEELAGKRSVSAMVHLGRMYQEGSHSQAHPEMALHWYQRAADCGLLPGYYYLGRLFLKLGRHEEALAAFRRAAAAEYAPALHQLGRMYFFGAGVQKDVMKSRSYLERAAKGRNLLAKFLLAKLLMQHPARFDDHIKGLWLRWTATVEAIFVAFFGSKTSERIK